MRSRLKESGTAAQNVGEGIAVFLFAYFAAYMETYTIESVRPFLLAIAATLRVVVWCTSIHITVLWIDGRCIL